MCSDLYDELTPLLLPNTQLPPTRSPFSKHVTGTPASTSAFSAVMPDEPAPITAVRGRDTAVSRGSVNGGSHAYGRLLPWHPAPHWPAAPSPSPEPPAASAPPPPRSWYDGARSSCSATST